MTESEPHVPVGTVRPGGEPKVTIRVIGRCNFRCPACSTFSNPERAGVLSLSDFEQIVHLLAQEDFRGVVNLSGGEPTLHPHLKKMIQQLSRTLPEARVVLFTNGSWVGAPGWRRQLAAFLAEPRVLVRFSLDRHHLEGALRGQGQAPSTIRLAEMKERLFGQARAFLSACSAMGARPGQQFDIAYKGTWQEARDYLAPLGNPPIYPITWQKDPARRPKQWGYLAIDLNDQGRPLVYPTLGHLPREPLGGLDTLPRALEMNRRLLLTEATSAEPALHSPKIGLEIKITDRCTHRCWFCMNNDSPEKTGDLDVEGFLARLGQWFENPPGGDWSLGELRITGGEPLLRLGEIVRIARFCREHGLPCGINTNGALLTPSRAALLKDAGVSLLKVSLNADEDRILAKMMGGPVSVAATTAALAAAGELGFTVILRFTLCGDNQEQLLPCYEMGRQLGVQRFQIKPLVRTGRALNRKGWLTRREVAAALDELARTAAGSAARPQVLCWPPELAGGLDTKVCGSLTKIYLDTGLLVTICNYLAGVRPFGHLGRQSLQEVLQKRIAPVWRSPVGHRLLAGCPQQSIFASPHLPGPTPVIAT